MKGLLFALALVVPCVAHAAEVASVEVRDGVSEAYLLIRSGTSEPKAIVFSFVGGEGAINLVRRAEKGPPSFGRGANFLIRVRDALAGDDIADVIVDAPSDRLPGGMTDDFRAGETHAADIAKVIAELQTRFPRSPIYLLGTSRGTISAANVAKHLGDAVKGVILASTVTVPDRIGPGLSRFDFGTIKVPMLWIHHRGDACRSSPYAVAHQAAGDAPFVSVQGGAPPESGPCEPLSPHGYFGREDGAVQVIRSFVLGRDYVREIALSNERQPLPI